MIHNQLGKRNLTAFVRAELALKLKPVIANKAKRRMLKGKTDPTQNSAEGETREKIAEAAGVSHDTIGRVEYLADKITDKTRVKLQTGETSINAEYKKAKSKDRKKAKKAEHQETLKSHPAGGDILTGDLSVLNDAIDRVVG